MEHGFQNDEKTNPEKKSAAFFSFDIFTKMRCSYGDSSCLCVHLRVMPTDRLLIARASAPRSAICGSSPGNVKSGGRI